VQQGSAGNEQQAHDEAAFFPLEEPLSISSLQIERKLKHRTYLGRCNIAMLCSSALPALQNVIARAMTSATALTCGMPCRYCGQPVAVRAAQSQDGQAAAQQEVAAYQKMLDLQGTYVPRLKAHGYTLGGRIYFVATEFIHVGLLLLFKLHHLP